MVGVFQVTIKVTTFWSLKYTVCLIPINIQLDLNRISCCSYNHLRSLLTGKSSKRNASQCCDQLLTKAMLTVASNLTEWCFIGHSVNWWRFIKVVVVSLCKEWLDAYSLSLNVLCARKLMHCTEKRCLGTHGFLCSPWAMQ